MRSETQPSSLTFNWLLPFLGALGFGVGFALLSAISSTRYDLAMRVFPGVSGDFGPSLEQIALRGIIVGGIGGAALGLAVDKRRRTVHFALAGAIGFAAAFTALISLDPVVVPNVGRAIMRVIGEPEPLFRYSVALAHGSGSGAIVGAIGGAVLGLASQRGRILSSLSLCLFGTVWFAIAFAIDATNFNRGFSFLWDGLGGAIGGAVLGMTLALLYMVRDRAPQ